MWSTNYSHIDVQIIGHVIVIVIRNVSGNCKNILVCTWSELKMFSLNKIQSIKQVMGGRYWSVFTSKVLETEKNLPEQNGWGVPWQYWIVSHNNTTLLLIIYHVIIIILYSYDIFILLSENNFVYASVQNIADPITACGNIHGQTQHAKTGFQLARHHFWRP